MSKIPGTNVASGIAPFTTDFLHIIPSMEKAAGEKSPHSLKEIL